MRQRQRTERGAIQGLSLVAFTILVVGAFVALEVGWRPSGPGSNALTAVGLVRKAAAALVAARRDPLPDVPAGSLDELVAQKLLDAKLTGGTLPIEGGGAVTRVKWVGVRNYRTSYVGITVEVPTREILDDLLSRVRRQSSFAKKPVFGLGCTMGDPPAKATSATLCFEL
ncbi:MAG: hypothetical protein ACOX6T_02545 [Myxococcales bacterium]|jgi:hypothetical protein